MRVIIINLKRSPERKQHALNECKWAGFVPQVLDATDALSLGPEWVAANTTSRLLMSLDDPSYRFMNPRALACSDSHRRVYATLLAENGDWPSVVLEDDYFWLHRRSVVREILLQVGQSEFDLTLLGYSPRQPFLLNHSTAHSLRYGYFILPYENVKRTGGAYGYMITSKAAEVLLSSQAAGIDREADDFAREMDRHGRDIRIGVLFPPMVHSNIFRSTIWPSANGSRLRDLKAAISSYSVRSGVLRRLYTWALTRRLARRYLIAAEG
jgi:GR25 family glycosyltransferase involved in LPS biosynthesis